MRKNSRRDLLKLAALGAVGATGLGFLANALYKMDRVSTELGEEVLTSSGTIVDKRFVKGGHLNPIDNFNPLADLNPIKQATKFPNKYNITVKYEYGTYTFNNRKLYDQVEKGDEVTVQFREVFEVKTTYEGEFLERKLKEYKLEKISPK